MKALRKGVFVACTLISAALMTNNANAQGNAYAIGDSLTDNGGLSRFLLGGADPSGFSSADGYVGGGFSNGPTWIETMPGLVGLGFEQGNDFAFGGGTSGANGLPIPVGGGNFFIPPTGGLTQTELFKAAQTQLSPDDYVGVWLGTNDIHPVAGTNGGVVDPNTIDSIAQATADTAAGNIASSMNSIRDIGGKNFILLNVYDMALINPAPAYANYNTTLATSATDKLNQQLATLEIEGANVHYLDVNSLVKRIIADPVKFGYTSVSAFNSCQDNACGSLSREQQNQFLFMDTIHFTAGFQKLLGEYAANLITAGGVTTLQAESGLGSVGSTQKNAMYRIGADLAKTNGGKVQWYVTPGVDVNEQIVSDITDNTASSDLTSISAGASYRVTKGLHVGAVANYTQSETDLSRKFGGNDFDYGQVGVFVAFRDKNLSADIGVTGTKGSFDLLRTGVMDDLSANPDADAFGAFAQVKYLFSTKGSNIKFGPIGSVSYTRLNVDGYTERGDSLITISTEDQSIDQLTANFGVTLLGKDVLSKGLDFQLQVTGEYQRTGDHDLGYYQTNAPTRRLSKLIDGDSELYGRVTGSLNYSYAEGQALFVTGTTTFGRDEGEQSGVSAGVKINY